MSTKNEQLFAQARKHIPGGVNSPVRAFAGVGGTPVFMHKASGSKIYDTEDNAYIDYIGSWGPMILGHGHPVVVEALAAAVANDAEQLERQHRQHAGHQVEDQTAKQGEAEYRQHRRRCGRDGTAAAGGGPQVPFGRALAVDNGERQFACG